MKIKIYKYILYSILIYTLILISSPKRYKSYLPTLPIYPNNEEEALVVLKLSKNRTQEDIDFFNLTDINMVPAFLPHVSETVDELNTIVLDKKVINYVLFFKYLINRARPYQINSNINYLDSVSGLTPSYPAGHAFQAHLLAHILTKRYPDKKDLFYSIAEKCDDCRVKAGIHYPSDGVFSKQLLKYFINYNNK